jgi:hypothetical protein
MDVLVGIQLKSIAAMGVGLSLCMIAPCGDARGTSGPPEVKVASLALGEHLSPKLRCSLAVLSDVETAHHFRISASGTGHSDGYLTIITECPTDECASQDEHTIVQVALASAPSRQPTCTLVSPPDLVTAKGLHLGDTAERVRKLYGKPAEAVPTKGPANVFNYYGRNDAPGIYGPRQGPNVAFRVVFAQGKADRIALFVNTDPH